jgi:hypothetical protein
MDIVVLIIGILWIIKGEIRVRKTPFWDERKIDSSHGRSLGVFMVIGILISIFLPREISVFLVWILIILPFVFGIAFSKKVITVAETDEMALPPICAGAKLRQFKLKGADLSGTDFRDADLREADLREANLSGADLSGADLSIADLRGANLHGADLRGAKLRGADLDKADLREADLCEVDLRWTDLREAYLTGAIFSQSDLVGANLSRVNLDKVDLHGAQYDDTTMWPKDFEPPIEGAVLR